MLRARNSLLGVAPNQPKPKTSTGALFSLKELNTQRNPLKMHVLPFTYSRSSPITAPPFPQQLVLTNSCMDCLLGQSPVRVSSHSSSPLMVVATQNLLPDHHPFHSPHLLREPDLQKRMRKRGVSFSLSCEKKREGLRAGKQMTLEQGSLTF